MTIQSQLIDVLPANGPLTKLRRSTSLLLSLLTLLQAVPARAADPAEALTKEWLQPPAPAPGN